METKNTELKVQAPIDVYEKPSIEIIEMETEGCILNGSDLGGGGGLGS